MKTRGFTLLEVMVAVAVIGLALTAITASISQMIDAASTMRMRTYANWIAQNRIAELRLAAQAPEIGASNGEVEYANADWVWRAEVSETGVEDLYRIDVSVSLAGGEPIRTVSGFTSPAGAAGMANSAWISSPRQGGRQQGPTT